MYNMEITLRIEIVILIVIIFCILWGHLIYSCSKLNGSNALKYLSDYFYTNKKQFDYQMSFPTLNEGFTGANINNGQSSSFNLRDNKPVDTSSWFTPNCTCSPGGKPSKGAEHILDRPPQPIPLPEGEMLMFATTEFKPECCPNAYSNSSGCACMDMKSYNYLINRGGNNVPYSEY